MQGHAHHSEVQEIRVRPIMGEHDIAFKLNQARTFLSHKDKVVVSVVLRGAELAHLEEGHNVMANFIKQLEEVSKLDSPPRRQDNRIVCILATK